MKKKRRKNRRKEKRRQEKRRKQKRRVENRREEQKIEEKSRKWKRRERRKIDCVKERACILQTFYHKNMFKNTLNFKINFIVKFCDIFEKKQLS